MKLAKELRQKGNVYVLDEPTTGLHPSDIQKIMDLLEGIVARGNTVIVIEHNTDVMKMADYIIDIGPDGAAPADRWSLPVHREKWPNPPRPSRQSSSVSLLSRADSHSPSKAGIPAAGTGDAPKTPRQLWTTTDKLLFDGYAELTIDN